MDETVDESKASIEGADAEQRALTAPAAPCPDDDASVDPERMPGHWRYELRRWLATLNPGRTGREYEKAVAYFFATPGVPQEVAVLTFDLLLAYRGALALRAADPARGAAYAAGPARMTMHPTSHAPLPGVAAAELEGGGEGSSAEREDGKAASRDAGAAGTADGGVGSLAPATVNIRLTALRQFLVHCSMMGVLTALSPDRIRTALKRLAIDRRRPYQILAESEWEGFLAAAALPAKPRPAVVESADSAASGRGEVEPAVGKSPWGITRAMRARQAEMREASTVGDGAKSHRNSHGEDGNTIPPLVRSRAGLTGERTAQRDHALIALALATGLRAIELSLLDLSDLTQEWHDGQAEWWLVLPDAKTKGQHGGRTLPLATSLVAELLAYVRSTNRGLGNIGDRSTPLFLSNRRSGSAHQPAAARGRLTAGQIGRIVDRVETQWVRGRETITGETRAISPHALRHSTAMALLEGSTDGARPPASVEHVRGWLGHFDIRTTQGYLAHLDARHHRRALKIALPHDDPGESSGQSESGQHGTAETDGTG